MPFSNKQNHKIGSNTTTNTSSNTSNPHPDIISKNKKVETNQQQHPTFLLPKVHVPQNNSVVVKGKTSSSSTSSKIINQNERKLDGPSPAAAAAAGAVAVAGGGESQNSTANRLKVVKKPQSHGSSSTQMTIPPVGQPVKVQPPFDFDGMRKESQEIVILNQAFKSYKTRSKSDILKHGLGPTDSPRRGQKPSKFDDGRHPNSTARRRLHNNSGGNSSVANEEDGPKIASIWPKRPKITFHEEDEMKHFIPHSRSYKLSIQRSPLGLDILTHADQLWIAQTGLETGWSPMLFEYDVFDDSEQKIITVTPEFASHLRQSFDSNDSTLMNERPCEFLCHTVVGKDLCTMTYDTTVNALKPNRWRKPVQYPKLEIWVREMKMAIVEQQQTTILVRNDDEVEIMECIGVPDTALVLSCCKGRKFQFKVFLNEGIKTLFGIIGRNVHGQPHGFYFYPVGSSTTGTPNMSLYKLYILAILIGLTTVYTELDHQF